MSASSAKPATGKTGVSLSFHERDEYRQLTKEQKDELREYRKSRGTNKGKGGQGNQGKWNQGKDDTKKLIAAAVENRLDVKLKEAQEGADDDDRVRSYLVTLLNSDSAKGSTP